MMKMITMNKRLGGWRWTRQRKAILKALEGHADHPTAEELHRILRTQDEEVSLATVYRTLRALASEGLIKEIRSGGPDRFDPDPAPHYHFRCTRCGGVYDVNLPYREDLDRIDLGSGFCITGHQLVWEGICPQCRAAKE